MIQHYAINFVSDLMHVGGFLRVLQFPPTFKSDLHDILVNSSFSLYLLFFFALEFILVCFKLAFLIFYLLYFRILGNRISELEKKIKTLEVAGLWNVPSKLTYNSISLTFREVYGYNSSQDDKLSHFSMNFSCLIIK